MGDGEEKPFTGKTELEAHGGPVFSSSKRTGSKLQSSGQRGNKAPRKTAFPWKEFIVLEKEMKPRYSALRQKSISCGNVCSKANRYEKETKVSYAAHLSAVLFSLKDLFLLFVLSTQHLNSNRIRRQNK